MGRGEDPGRFREGIPRSPRGGIRKGRFFFLHPRESLLPKPVSFPETFPFQERCIKTGTLTVNYEKVDLDYKLKHNDLLANVVHR